MWSPRFTVSCAANLPGVLHSLEPCIIGDEKMRRRNNVVKFRLSDDEIFINGYEEKIKFKDLEEYTKAH